ncbi:MAG: metallophosphoesterase [Methanobacterium sp.]|nr:metallophosphoesterase [Methanobacterium sp.]
MIGIMADSHDNLDAIRMAVDFFNKSNVSLVIHAGDLVSPFTAKEFKELNCEFKAVFGNNDGEKEGLRKNFKDLFYLDSFIEFEVQKKKFAVNHGTKEAIVDALVKSRKYDVVIRGHTHKLEIKKDEALLINPGETCGYLSGQKTVVLLDPNDLSYKTVFL